MTMTLGRAQAGAAVVVTVSGDVDLGTAHLLSEQVVALLEDGAPAIVVDLGDVTFLDSSGLSALVVSLHAATAHERQFVIARATDQIGVLLRVTGLDGVIPVSADVAAALEQVAAPR